MNNKIQAEASHWLLRLEDNEDLTARAEFSEWLTRSPLHVEAYLAVSVASRALEEVSGDAFDTDALIAAARAEETNNVVVLPSRGAPPVAKVANPPRRRLFAAAAALLVASAIGWAGYQRFLPPESYLTGANESRTVTLADGSVVELDHDSAIELHWTKAERRIELRQGAGRFTVAKNPDRPFIVATAVTSVRAVGTVFSVQALPGDAVVSVSEGKVKVEPVAAKPTDQPIVQLTAGDRAVISHHAHSEVSVSAWAAQRLVFRGTALGTVVEEFNRHGPTRLALDDKTLASVTVSGVFDPADVDSFLKYLEQYEGVRIGRQADGSIRMSPGTRPIK